MKNRTAMGCGIITILLVSMITGQVRSETSQSSELRAEFARQHPGTGMLDSADGRIHRIFGRAFSTGDSPIESASTFIDRWSRLYDVPTQQIMPGGLDSGRIHQQPIYYLPESDSHRFTGVYHQQAVDGVPVFGTRLLVLVRNEPGFPAVLAGSDLKPIGSWRPQGHRTAPSASAALGTAERFFGEPAQLVDEPSWLVFAGGEDEALAPRLVMRVEAMAGDRFGDTYRRWLLLVDAETGAILYDEDRILNCFPAGAPTALASVATGDITGTIEGYSTTSSAADECEPEEIMAFPYLRVTGDDGSWTYADADGNFTLVTDEGESLQLTSTLEGRWFRVDNQIGENTSVSQPASDGDAVEFLHNADNEEEYVLAQANAYVQANIVRDFVLQHSPAYPIIVDQLEFPTNVNIDDSCNAYYDYSSTNYYIRAGSCNNTAFSGVVHHEYGHHLVSCAGSGQGAYGEGMGDVMSVLVTLDNYLGRGFYQGQCTTGIRNADNSCQLSSNCSTCGNEIHACGQLISGCVWSTREELMVSGPNGHDVISSLAINAMLLHTGTAIDESIVIDYLTLDDDDSDIGNGTPHYQQISAGFGSHGIDAPQLDYLSFTFPNGLPEQVDPSGGTVLQFGIDSNLATFDPGTEEVWIDAGGGFLLADVQENSPGAFQAEFPAAECGTPIRYYLKAITTDGTWVFNPADWPKALYGAYSAYDVNIAIDDHFQTDQGWTPSGTSPTPWVRSAPQPSGGNWRPETDFDGDGGLCFHITQPELDGTAILTSPTIDAGGGGELTFAFWLGQRQQNPAQADDGLQLLASINNGQDWTVVRDWHTYENAWRADSLAIGPDGELPATSSLRLRFIAMDEDVDNRVSVAIDAFEMIAVDCEQPPCPSDFNSDGMTSVDDLLWLIAGWGGPEGDIDGNGSTTVDDLLILIQNWGPCS